MGMTDPLADMLTRMRNANKAKHEKIDVPASNLKSHIARLLKEEGYIKNYKVIKDGKQGVLRIYLKYQEGTNPILTNLERVSRPGRRVYVAKDEIPRVMGGLGVAIISTTKGVLTDKEARSAGLGGELVARVW